MLCRWLAPTTLCAIVRDPPAPPIYMRVCFLRKAVAAGGATPPVRQGETPHLWPTPPPT